MADHWAVFKQETLVDGHEHTQVDVFETEQEAYDEADRLNDARPSYPADYYFYVREVYDPFETLEEVDELFGYWPLNKETT